MAEATEGQEPQPSARAEDGGGPMAATTAVLKAYANPIRRQILKQFAKHEFRRAADVAEALDIPANKVSFHLRVLAEAGLLVEAPEQARDRRDRVWRAEKRAMNIGGPEHPVEDPVLGGAVLQALIDDHNDILRRMAAWTPTYMAGQTTEVHAEFAQMTVRLTEAEFQSFMTRIGELKDEILAAHERGDAGREDTRVWQIDVIAADDTI